MDLNRVLGFLGDHPEAQPAAELSVAAPAPEGYDTVRYHSVHVFWLVAADGARQPVRYRWQPAAGVQTISDEDAATRPPDYLQSGLGESLAAGPVAFDLDIVLGQPATPPTTPPRCGPRTARPSPWAASSSPRCATPSRSSSIRPA